MKTSQLLVAIAIISILTFLALHRIAAPFGHLPATSENEEIKRLMVQTKQLLKDIAVANLSLSVDAIKDIEVITQEENLLNFQSQENQIKFQTVENSLSQCLLQQKQSETENEECRKKITFLEEKLQEQSLTIRSQTIDSNPITNALDLALTSLSSSKSSSKSNLKWLVIGIPTVARRNNEDYLLKSLQKLADQLPLDSHDILYEQIIISIINVQVDADPNRKHIIYEKAKQLYGPTSKYANYFEFSEMLLQERTTDPIPGRNPRNDPGNANKPGFLVRRQTRDIVYVIRKNINKAQHYLFLEDDMQLCGQGFMAIQYLLRKADRYHPNWLAIRASYGMNGIFMHNDDLNVFADYLMKNQIRRPPDHLVVEWFAGESQESAQYKQLRKNIGFKFNLFDHLGVVSTLRGAEQTSFPRCYEFLYEPTVFKVEAYNPRECPGDDIWPCDVSNQDKLLIDWSQVR
jgi:hypothetical protein